MVLPQLAHLMSPCLVTWTFMNVNRQYGHVMVGIDLATVSLLRVQLKACCGMDFGRSAVFGDRSVGMACSG